MIPLVYPAAAASLSRSRRCAWSRHCLTLFLGAAASFNRPNGNVVDGEGTIVVAGIDNHRMCKIVGGQVTTLAGSSEPGTADGTGAVARFNQPYRLAFDERGRLLVAEAAGGEGRTDTLRVVEAAPWQTWCCWWRGSVSPRTGECLRRGASIPMGCSCRGCRGGVRRVGCRRSSK